MDPPFMQQTLPAALSGKCIFDPPMGKSDSAFPMPEKPIVKIPMLSFPVYQIRRKVPEDSGKMRRRTPLFNPFASPGDGALSVIGMDTHKTDARQSVLSSGDEVCHQ